MRILITGGAGFIGHHIIEHLLKHTDAYIVSLDRLGVSGNYNRLKDMEVWEQEGHRVTLVHHDMRSPLNSYVSTLVGQVDFVLHLAASTHVDRSIENPMEFVLDNVVATTNLLSWARTQDHLKAFLYFSTDEVFGPAPAGTAYREWDRYNSGNPYAAAKAGGEEMALAFANTYGIPVIITHTMNVTGERQHPEKFIPGTIRKIFLGEKVIIHSNKDRTKAGSRFYIHARNVADAILFLMNRWEHEPHVLPRPTYWRMPNADKFNIVGEREIDNLELAQMIAGFVGKPLDYELVDFHSSRPGHDLRYALDGSKLAAMGWTPPKTIDDSLRKVVEWSLLPENRHWIGL